MLIKLLNIGIIDIKTQLYEEIYKVQYQRRLLETVVGIISGTPNTAITQGTLQIAATKMREESLTNSRLFGGISDGTTTLTNTSHHSGYFDGVKLGGVRIDLDAICGKSGELSRCSAMENGMVYYQGNATLPKLVDVMNQDKNPDAKSMYGLTGGVQAQQGGWYLPLGLPNIMYNPNDFSDKVIESFAGTHDYLGGQIWKWYDNQGNTSRNRGMFEKIGSSATTGIAIPVSAPFALSDLLSPDAFGLLFKLGGK